MRNRVKDEVEAMNWDEYIADPVGDLRRENESLRRLLHFWRVLALKLLVVLSVLVVLILFGRGR